MSSRKCRACGKFFSNGREYLRRYFCGNKCKFAALRNGSQVSCRECGGPTYRTPCQLRVRSHGVFCSKPCLGKYQGRLYAVTFRNGSHFPCVKCGKQVYRSKWKQASGGRVFCSRGCFYSYGQAGARCAACRRSMTVKASRKARHICFCSKECRRAFESRPFGWRLSLGNRSDACLRVREILIKARRIERENQDA